MHRLRWTADTAQIGISRSPGLYHHVGFRRKKNPTKKRESVLFPSIGVFAVTQNIAAARDKSSASPKCIAPAGRNTFSARSCSCSMVTGTSVPTTFQQCSFRVPVHTGRAHVCHVSVRDWSRGKGRVFATDELMSEKLRKRIVSKTNENGTNNPQRTHTSTRPQTPPRTDEPHRVRRGRRWLAPAALLASAACRLRRCFDGGRLTRVPGSPRRSHGAADPLLSRGLCHQPCCPSTRHGSRADRRMGTQYARRPGPRAQT